MRKKSRMGGVQVEERSDQSGGKSEVKGGWKKGNRKGGVSWSTQRGQNGTQNMDVMTRRLR